MAIKHGRGKARPTLPSLSEVRPIAAGTEPPATIHRGGPFKKGNKVAVGRSWKASVRALLGRRDAPDKEMAKVAHAAKTIFEAAVREMPVDGVLVRLPLAEMARHQALEAYWHAKAAEVGLSTSEGITAEDRALKHGQRAERLLVTALDAASKMSHLAKGRAKPAGLAEVLGRVQIDAFADVPVIPEGQVEPGPMVDAPSEALSLENVLAPGAAPEPVAEPGPSDPSDPDPSPDLPEAAVAAFDASEGA